MQRTFKVCDEALQAARLTATDLDGVILVGGSTRLPFVREMVQHYFKKIPDTAVDPDQVVALGAALHGHGLVHSGTDAMLLDVTPLTLRIGTVAGFAEEVIAKNTPVPMERSRTFTTVRDNQDRVMVRVLQGESRRAEECTLLGEFEFTGLRAAPRGQVTIEVRFEIDASGIVNVAARDVQSLHQAKTTIRLSSGLSSTELEESKRKNATIRLVDIPEVA